MDLIKHAYISDEEFVKTILSSGDFFPEFYRFTMGDRNEELGQLTIDGLLAAMFDKPKDRKAWFKFTKHRLSCADTRNRERSDDAVYELINKKYTEWMLNGDTYDIAVIEIDNGVSSIEVDQTYFLMGSLIRFTKDHLLIGYDMLRDTATITVPINFNDIKEYCNTIYGKHLQDFFLPSDVVASVKPDSGRVHMTDETMARAMTSHSNSVLIASNRDVSHDLPIRWAKDILLSDYDY